MLIHNTGHHSTHKKPTGTGIWRITSKNLAIIIIMHSYEDLPIGNVRYPKPQAGIRLTYEMDPNVQLARL